jgi:hypothetical protein
MMRDQLRLVLQPDDQLVKITTVIAIDDHSDGEHAAYDKTAKHTGVFPHSSTATASPGPYRRGRRSPRCLR